MKYLNGFGKKYYSLSSIQAHSVAISLHNIVVCAKNHISNRLKYSSQEDEILEEQPLDIGLLTISSFIQSKKACHCDCFFKIKTAIAVALFKFIPRCPYYNTFFAFRRTGVHPPFI